MLTNRINTYLLEAKNKFHTTLPEYLESVGLTSQSKLKDYYITFSNVLKFGVNPSTRYDTPLGIYSYPLSADNIYRNILIERNPQNIPFAGDAKYIFLFRNNGYDTTVYSDTYTIGGDRAVDDIKTMLKFMHDHGMLDYNFMIKGKLTFDEAFVLQKLDPASKLVSVYKDYGRTHAITYLIKNFNSHYIDLTDNIVSDMLNKIYPMSNKFKNVRDWTAFHRLLLYPEALMHNYIKIKYGSVGYSKSTNPAALLKLNLYKNILGYTGLVDNGVGVIHPNEPEQAVFFSKEKLEVVSMFINNYGGTLHRPGKEIDNSKASANQIDKSSVILNPYEGDPRSDINNSKSRTEAWANLKVKSILYKHRDALVSELENDILLIGLDAIIKHMFEPAVDFIDKNSLKKFNVKVFPDFKNDKLMYLARDIMKPTSTTATSNTNRRVYELIVSEIQDLISQGEKDYIIKKDKVDLPRVMLEDIAIYFDKDISSVSHVFEYYKNNFGSRLKINNLETKATIVTIYTNYINNMINSQLSTLTPYILKAAENYIDKLISIGPSVNPENVLFKQGFIDSFSRIILKLFKRSKLGNNTVILYQFSVFFFFTALLNERIFNKFMLYLLTYIKANKLVDFKKTSLVDGIRFYRHISYTFIKEAMSSTDYDNLGNFSNRIQHITGILLVDRNSGLLDFDSTQIVKQFLNGQF